MKKMIKISFRDVLADLPPSILKKRIKEIEDRSRFEKLEIDELISKLKEIKNIDQWSLLFNKENRGGYYNMQSPAKIKEIKYRGDERVEIISDFHSPISFTEKSIGHYSFNFDYSRKLITVQVNNE